VEWKEGGEKKGRGKKNRPSSSKAAIEGRGSEKIDVLPD